MKFQILIFFTFLIYSCSHVNKNNPLENTKKLTRDGHLSLYNNGAFQIPMTKIKLIPEGPGPLSLAAELSGASAKASFLTALSEAAESVKIVARGSKKSYTLATELFKITNEISEQIAAESKTSGTWVISRSSDVGQKINADSFELSPKIKKEMQIFAELISTDAQHLARKGSDDIKNMGTHFKNAAYSETQIVTKDLHQTSKKLWSQSKNTFVEGYIDLPQKLSEQFKSEHNSVSLKNYATGFNSANEKRTNWSKELNLIISNSVSEFPDDAKDNFLKAQSEFNNSSNTVGFTFAAMKATGWVLYGLLWEGSLKPFLKMGSASIGYIFVNGVAYPAMLTANTTLETGKVIIEISKNTATGAYEIIAPTTKAALSAILSGAVLTASTATSTSGKIIAETGNIGFQIAAPIFKYSTLGTAETISKTVEYIGIPLTQAGIYAGSAVTGVVTTSSGFVAGQTLRWGGKATSYITNVAGTVASGATILTGTTLATAHASVHTLYQIGKSTTVPTAKILGGGLVLSYGTLSQLTAHTILAASDASYLVLSMEGPSFVVYSVQGVFSKGENLPTNAIVNLEELQRRGEVIKKIPATREDLEKILKHLDRKYSE